MIILSKFKGAILGISNYGANYKWTLDDFMNKEKLLLFLYELDCSEAVLTKKGFLFLKEFYGLKTIIQYILDEIRKGVDYKYQTEEELMKWIYQMNDLVM